MFQRLAGDKTLLFWTLQLGGWLGYAALNYLAGVSHNKGPDYWMPTLIYAAGGVVITWGLRWVFKSVWNRSPLVTWSVSAIFITLAAVLFAGFKTFVYLHVYDDWALGSYPLLGYVSVFDVGVSLYVLVSWSALYFGIKYYRLVQQQNEQVLKATSTAHQAQLKMLRYQLNPHFLFNTLNAISTLVLEGDADTANRMVTRLSQFLRYSLDRDPKQKVTLARELDALQLYLSIEKVRFEERLNVEIDLEPGVERALVPSMILQPLIENAVKYAIAVSEDGGTIKVRAGRSGDRLRLEVADDGPGLPDPEEALEPSRNGVGLANTRERLSVLYGPHQRFELETLEPRGLAVRIRIPFETSD